MKKTLMMMALVAAALVGCGKQDVSFDTLETARTQAKANAEYNALKFRAENPQYSNTALRSRVTAPRHPRAHKVTAGPAGS